MAYGIVSSTSSTIINGSGTTVAYLAAPTLTTDTFVYDASNTIDITDYLEDYDARYMTIGGDTTAQDAGEYTTTFDLKTPATQHWGDDSITVKSVTWTITKQPVSVPAVTNTSKTYNTNAQSPTIAAYDTNVIAVSGNTGTNAGSYTVTFTLKDTANYEWDSTATTKAWSIAKAAGSVSVSPTSLTLTTSSSTKTATITRAGDGTITAVSSNTGVATCGLTGTTVSATAVANGSTVITISVAEGTNYLATSTTLSVTSQLPSTTLNSNSWSVISEVAQAGTGDTYWDVGDCKEITLNGTVGDSNTSSQTFTSKSLCVFILHFNYPMNGTAENNIIFGGFKTALTSGKDVALYSFKMNSSDTNANGWKGCDMRFSALGNGSSKNTDATQANITSPKANTLMSAIPADMRNVVRLWHRWVDGTGSSSNTEAGIKDTIDVCTLLAEFEIFGSRSYANDYEKNHQTQMAYYKAGNSKVKYNHSSDSSAVYWWECSPRYDSGRSFCHVYSNGYANDYIASGTYGLAPAWKI